MPEGATMAEFPGRYNFDDSTVVYPHGEAVTPTDGLLWAQARTVYCAGAGGTLVVYNDQGVATDYGTISAEKIVLFKCRGVLSTGTTATKLISCW